MGPDFHGFLEPPAPQNIEKRTGDPSKIKKIEFLHMAMKVIGKITPNTLENGPEIDQNRHQNVIAKLVKKSVIKLTPKISNLGSKLRVFVVFWCQNRLQSSLETNLGPEPQKHKKIN